MDNHVCFPLVLEVASTEYLNECENNPCEEKYKPMHEEEWNTVFGGSIVNVGAHFS